MHCHLTPNSPWRHVTRPDTKKLVLMTSAVTSGSVVHMAGSRMNGMVMIPPNAVRKC